MARSVKTDLEELNVFIDSYNLLHLRSDTEYNKNISKIHKKYFAYLSYIAELNQYLDDSDYPVVLTQPDFDFIRESCSDVGLCFFSIIHGNYKPSKLVLRSSIETFIKGYYLSDIPDLHKEKSVFEIFRQVKIFAVSEPHKTLLRQIHSYYKLLCEDVHTASDINMSNVSALNTFPNFDIKIATKVSDMTINLISNYITLLALKYNDQFHKFHFRNKEIMLEAINKIHKSKIHNID